MFFSSSSSVDSSPFESSFESHGSSWKVQLQMLVYSFRQQTSILAYLTQTRRLGNISIPYILLVHLEKIIKLCKRKSFIKPSGKARFIIRSSLKFASINNVESVSECPQQILLLDFPSTFLM